MILASVGEPSVDDTSQESICSSIGAGRVDDVKICRERGDSIVADEGVWRKVIGDHIRLRYL